ncbi:MAG: RNA 2',3'-cyclic phosphodiesterase [Gammaproteobacteria bacterium]|nr:RNA 2',3'-cyclic phosphodiesterase [Gammaproteobacteria bacterium]
MSKKRLFFGLVPEQGIRDQLIEVAKSFPIVKGVRPISNDNLHITLLFLGDVEENVRKCLEKKVIQTFIQIFTVRLDLYGYFKTSQAMWLGSASCPGELTRLVKHLKSIGVQSGVKFDDRPHKPHVTLFRNVSSADFPNVPISINWNVHEFHLLESVPDGKTTRYNKIATYRLMDE